MIRVIVWKEFRDQGLIGLTLMVLGTGILTTAAVLAARRAACNAVTAASAATRAVSALV